MPVAAFAPIGYTHRACFNLTPAKDRAIRQIDVSGSTGVSAAIGRLFDGVLH